MSEIPTNRLKLFMPFQMGVICAGISACLFSVLNVEPARFDLHFAAIVALTLFLGYRIVVPMADAGSQISISETFVFLTMLFYGGDYAILLAATEGFISSHRLNKKLRTNLFNLGCAAVTTFVTYRALHLIFGDINGVYRHGSPVIFGALLAVMATTQYVGNSGLVAIGTSLRTSSPILSNWKRNYRWTSIAYLTNASAAGLIAKLVDVVGFYAFMLVAPIIAIVFFTYRTYLKSVESAKAQAEQADRHLRELSHYIAEQERIREQFSQVEKLSALGELASGVAHDFNNTLAGILGRAQLLLRTNDPDKIKRGLNIIIKTAEDGAKTVKRIQDFARQRRDKDFALVAVDQLLMDVSEITRPRWKNKSEAANIHINLAVESNATAKVMGDESELREVLINMVFNALDAMPNGGKLKLSTEDVGESVVIAVSDTGNGMSADVRSKIFDPFFTTKGAAGLGLGLAVSFGIIRRHEASIEVESEVGQGTTFRIILPAARTTAVPETQPEQQPTEGLFETTPADRPRILVVDDEDYVRELLRDILETEGCQVSLAENGRQALALLESQDFSAIFTDVGMPGMSGWEVAQAVRQNNDVIPIAVITGWGEAVGSKEQKQAGVDWVVTKPFTAERIGELAKTIKDHAKTKTNIRQRIVAAA